MLVEGKMTEKMVKEQIGDFMIAGFETTSSTISYAILALAMNPNIQEDVFNELKSVYDTQNEDTTYEHIQKLHILERVIKET